MKVCPQCGTKYDPKHRFCTLDGATLVSSAPYHDLVGSVIADRYHIIAKLGDGGMGQVYLAEHVRMKRKCAVKVMRPGLMNDPDAISRFNREAENASQVIHQHVAAVYDFGETSDGLIYLAMEFVDGESLAKVVEREQAIHPVRAAEIVRQASEALDVAHGLGILHRDLKPENIMLGKTRDGLDLVKIVDFGIARAMTSDAQRVTRTGSMVGTPEYMSPEQFAGDALDARTDIYSLALVAFNMLTGASAYPAGTSKDNLIVRLTQPPRRLHEVRNMPWPESLQAAFDKALASDPAQRYSSVLDFSRDVSAAVASMPASQTGEIYLSAIAAALAARTASTPSRPMTPISGTAPAITGESAPVTVSVPQRRRFSPMLAIPVGLAIAAVGFLLTRNPASSGAGDDSGSPDSGAAITLSDTVTLGDTASPGDTSAGVSEEQLYNRYRSSVLSVVSGSGSGLGFLVDSTGLLITASHLVRPDAPVSVMINDTMRVRARVIYSDSARDVAVVQIPRSRCARCAVLPVATADTGSAMQAGAPLLSFGTTRIARTRLLKGNVTAVSPGLITATTKVTAAESGTPLVTLDSQVVAIGVAPPVGRARTVSASVLRDALANAKKAIASGGIAPPSDSLLPVRPATPFPAEPIAAVVGSNLDLRKYRAAQGDVQIVVMTPPVMALRDAKADTLLVKVRAAGRGGAAYEKTDPVQLWKGWDECIRNRCAVVLVNAMPEKLPFPVEKAPEFVDLARGDVRSITLMRDGVVVEPIDVTYFPAVVNPAEYETRKKPVLSQGVAMYRIRDFAPRPVGGPSRFEVVVIDATRPDRPARIQLSAQLLQSIVNELTPYGFSR